LKRYSLIIIDEAHERTVNTDVLLGLLKRMLLSRKALKVVIMSATIGIKKNINLHKFPFFGIKILEYK
jgi:HrpA-like RNA helicase